MIAHRFRAVGWVAVVASAATGLYLVSLQVAAERGKLEAVEHQIVLAQRDMRQLQTELGTRASMRQLERWNGEVLALSAPKAAQFVQSGTQLVSLNLDDTSPNAPPPVMQAVATPKLPQVDEPTIRNTNYLKPAEEPKVQRVALLEPASLREVNHIAIGEGRKRP